MADTGPHRRGFLGYCTAFLTAALGLLVAVPAVGYVCAPLRRGRKGEGEAGFVDVGPVAELPAGRWSLRPLEMVRQDGWKESRVRRSVWVYREGVGDRVTRVLSPLCPHLGCPINWQTDRRQFSCPCHGGTFADDGSRLAGPPPRSMDPLAFEVRAGRLWVRWQDFRIGVAERAPVST